MAEVVAVRCRHCGATGRLSRDGGVVRMAGAEQARCTLRPDKPSECQALREAMAEAQRKRTGGS